MALLQWAPAIVVSWALVWAITSSLYVNRINEQKLLRKDSESYVEQLQEQLIDLHKRLNFIADHPYKSPWESEPGVTYTEQDFYKETWS